MNNKLFLVLKIPFESRNQTMFQLDQSELKEDIENGYKKIQDIWSKLFKLNYLFVLFWFDP